MYFRSSWRFFWLGLRWAAPAASWLIRKVSARLALGWSQILLSVGIAWAAYMIADSLPYWSPRTALLENNPWHNFQIDLWRCLLALLPPTLLWGASFPLACAAAASPGRRPGTAGRQYVRRQHAGIDCRRAGDHPDLDSGHWHAAVRARIADSLRGERAVLACSASMEKSIARGRRRLRRALAMAGVGALSCRVHAIPGALIAYGRRMTLNAPASHVLYTAEGMNSSVAITRWDDGATEVDVNGHVEATTEPFDMKLQRMVGHLPALLHPASAIGAGNRIWRGSFGRHIHPLSQHSKDHDLRNRTHHPAHLHALFRARRL